MFLAPKANESLLGYYKRECTDKNLKIVMKIIDMICVNNYDNMSENFKREIVEFTEEFKKDRPEYFRLSQDAIVFRLYSEIISENLKIQKEKIHENISENDRKIAKEFARKIFSVKTDMTYVASVGTKTYTGQLKDIKDLSSVIEFIIYSGIGVILFYFIKEDKKKVMGFKFKKENYTEIKKEELKALLGGKADVVPTVLSELI